MKMKRYKPSTIFFVIGAAAVFAIVEILIQVGLLNSFWNTILRLGAVMAILSLGLNLIYGFNGQFSLGHAAFLAIGAYASAIVVAAYNFPFLIGLFVAGVMAAVLGLVIGVPTLRLRGDYLAIATLGFAEITKMVLLIMPEKVFGGATGIPVIGSATHAGRNRS